MENIVQPESKIEKFSCLLCEKITFPSEFQGKTFDGLADSNRLFFVAEGSAEICKMRGETKNEKRTILKQNQILLCEDSSAFPIVCEPKCEVYFFAFFGNLSAILSELALSKNTVYQISDNALKDLICQYIEDDHMGILIGRSFIFTSFVLQLLTKISRSLCNVFLSESVVGINGFSWENSAMREEGVFHGRKAIKIIPNYSGKKCVVLENYKLTPYNINLKNYGWLQIQYYYESRDSAKSEAWLRILNFCDNSSEERVDIYDMHMHQCSFFAPLKRNQWCSAIFCLKYPPTVQKIIDESQKPILRQIKIAPFGMRYNTELPKDDIMYISSVSFYTQNPEHLQLTSIREKCNIGSVLALMDTTFNKNYDLSYYADFCHLSLSYFLRWFKEQTGITPHQHIINKQIEYAKYHISMEGIKIENLAADAGFADPHYFARIFKKSVGMTPSEYRKMIIENM